MKDGRDLSYETVAKLTANLYLATNFTKQKLIFQSGSEYLGNKFSSEADIRLWPSCPAALVSSQKIHWSKTVLFREWWRGMLGHVVSVSSDWPGTITRLQHTPRGWNWGMLVNIWRLTADSHLFYYLRTHPRHHSVDRGKRKTLLLLFPTQTFNVQVDFWQWGNLEVPQPIRNVKFMLPSELRSYLIRLRSSYTRTNYYNYSLGKFKSV